MNDADLLIEVATLDEVEATIPTCADQDAGRVPGWCELVLSMKREADSDGAGDDGPGTWPINTGHLTLRRHDGELILEVLHSVLHPDRPTGAGEAIWEELDVVMDRIQARVAKGKEPMKRDVGEALGLAKALAYLNDLIEPDLDSIRAQAVERYEARH